MKEEEEIVLSNKFSFKKYFTKESKSNSVHVSGEINFGGISEFGLGGSLSKSDSNSNIKEIIEVNNKQMYKIIKNEKEKLQSQIGTLFCLKFQRDTKETDNEFSFQGFLKGTYDGVELKVKAVGSKKKLNLLKQLIFHFVMLEKKRIFL